MDGRGWIDVLWHSSGILCIEPLYTMHTAQRGAEMPEVYVDSSMFSGAIGRSPV